MNTVVTIAGRVAGMASLLLLLGIGGCHQATAPEVAGGSVGLKQGQVQPRAVDGGKQPAVKPDLTQPLNVEENPPFVPVGPARGKMAPQNKASRNEAIKSGKKKTPGSGRLEPKRVEGGKYPAVKPNLSQPLNQEEDPAKAKADQGKKQ